MSQSVPSDSDSDRKNASSNGQNREVTVHAGIGAAVQISPAQLREAGINPDETDKMVVTVKNGDLEFSAVE